jgi:VCBS repeat-containing protein
LGSGRTRKIFAAAVAALLVVISAVLVASAATSPATMRFACASDLYNAKNVLHFVRKASDCTGAGKTLVRFKQDYPVYVCRKLHGHTRGHAKQGIYSHGPAGLVRLVDRPSKCAPPSQPNEAAMTLPRSVDTLFCAAKQGGELRYVRSLAACNGREFGVVLKKRKAPPTDRPPVANPDSATTDEATPKSIAVLSNDTDPNHDPLQVASVDTAGTKGSVTVSADGKSVTYDPNGKFRSLKQGETATDTFTYKAKDGQENSNSATVTVTITGLNEAPVAVDDAATTDKGHSKQIAVLANDTDGDGDALSVSSVDRTGTKGNVTVNGDGTVTYDPNGQFDSLGPNQTAHDTFKYKATDGHVDSNAATVDVTVTGANNAPVVTTTSGSTPYTEGAAATAVDGGVTVSDPDSASLASAQARVSAGFQAGDSLVFVNQNGISGSYNSGTGVLTLTGSSSVANYQTALRSVKYSTGTNKNPSTSKTVEFKVNDGALDSAPATKNIAVTPVNDPPAVATSGGQASYTEGSSPVQPDPAVNVTDPDSAQLQSATVSITTNFTSADGDTLNFTNQNGIVGSYNSATGVLTLTGNGTVANYQDALRSVTFSFTSQNPSTATRTVAFQATDTGGAASNVATRNVGVTATNTAPTVTTTGGNTAYTEGAAGTPVDGGVTPSDPDSANLASATVSISANFQAGDNLGFANQNGITGSYNTGTGVLTLTGSSSVANYQTALRSITYDSGTNQNPSASKTVSFKVSDGALDSNTATKGLAITPVNNAPTVTTSGGQASYTEGSSPVQPDPAVNVTDPDSAQLQGATVSITTNFTSADGDTLNFTNQNGISGSYNPTTGVLTLSGNASVANYQAALRSVTFSFTSQSPSTATRTVSFQATDTGGAASNTATRNVGVTATNTAPTVTTTGGNTAYTEGAAGTPVDGGVTPSDPDSPNLASATVSISANFQAGDNLGFANQNGITGSYNTGTGVLTLTGSSSVANYQTALRSITYDSGTNQNPSASKTVSFKVNDGSLDSNTATKGLAITPVNNAPTVTTSGGQASYTEGSSPTQPDPALNVTDPDSTQLQGATVSITTNFTSADGDTLNFTNQNGISGSYNSATGVLTLSGNSSVANYQAALRSVTFSFTSQNPSTATRTVAFQATDTSGAASNTATRDVGVTATNTAPSVTTTGGSTAYTEGAAGTPVDGGVTPSDPDSANLASATVSISANFQAGDNLGFANQNGITGSYNSGTGVLTLTGSSSVANYQTALRSITYDSGSDHNPQASKTVSFTVNDGSLDSNTATKGLAITPVNTAPTVTTTASNLAYTEGDGAVAADSMLTVTDADSAQLQGATVAITGNFVSADDTLGFTNQNGISGSYNSGTGVLTLSGNSSVANYETALRSVTYSNSSQNPSGSKTLSFQATDTGGAASNVATRQVDLTNVNNPPTVTTSGGSTAYTEGDPPTTVDGSLTVTDPDSPNLASAKVRISSGFQPGDTLTFLVNPFIVGSYNASTGVLTFTGSRPVSDYQAVLRSVNYSSGSNQNPSTPKQIGFVANDGSANSNEAFKSIDITGVNNGPVINTTASPLAYTEGDPPTPVDNGVTISDPEGDQISGATVQITGNYSSSEDVLAFTNQNGITGIYNSGTGLLSLSGTTTATNYQTALRSITYQNTSNNPSTLTRTVSFQGTDNGTPNAAGNVATRDINVGATNNPPVVTTSGGSTAYTEGAPSTAVDNALTVSDVDSPNLASAQVRISNNFESGDSLNFANQNGITGSYNSGTGVLTLTGSSSVANYQTALRSVGYSSGSNQNPATSKDVEFKVNDGLADSNTPTKNLAITRVNNAPTLTTSGGSASYTEQSAAVQPDPGLTLTDPDSANAQGAVVSITSNFSQANGDTLSFTNQNGITGSYNATTGVLTLSGVSSIANYEAALRSVTFSFTSHNPSTLPRTVSFKATDDSGADSNTATRQVNVTAVDDAPVVTTTGGSTAYTERAAAVAIDSGVTVSDVDNANLASAQVRVSSGFDTGDSLVFSNQNGITGSYNSGTGVLTLTGSSSVANYQTALQSVQFSSTNHNPTTSKTIEFKANDGTLDSAPATKNIAVTPVNDAPTVTTTASALAYTEKDPATVIDSNVAVTDPDSTNANGATVSITTNFNGLQDVLSFVNTANITGSYNSGTGVMTLSGTDTIANYQAALRTVKYQNTSAAPTPTPGPTASRTISFQVTDSGNAASNVATRDITITKVNDPPVANDDTAVTDENTTINAPSTTPPVNAPNVLTNDTDPDGVPPDTQTVTKLNNTNLSGGTASGTSTKGAAVTLNSNGTWTYVPGTIFKHLSTGESDSDSFTYTMKDSAGATSSATVNITVNGVSDPPVGVADSYNGIGNTGLFVGTTKPSGEAGKVISGPTATVLNNDTDPDTPHANLVVESTSGQATTQGGTVSMNSDGTFTYHPPVGVTGVNDTFTYRVCDVPTCNNTTAANDQGSGTVTIPLAGKVWYVKNDAPVSPLPDGTSSKPYKLLSQADSSAGSGDTTFVYKGDGTTTGYNQGYTMAANERLLGEVNGLTLGADTLYSPVANAYPNVTNLNADVITLASGAELRGFNVDPQGSGGGITGTTIAGATIDNNTVVDTTGAPQIAGTGAGLKLTGTTGTVNVSNLTVNNKATGVLLNSDATVQFAPSGTISVTSDGGPALSATSTSFGGGGGSTFDDLTSTNSSTGGVLLSGTTGNVQLGDGSGTDLSLTTSSGAPPALQISNHTSGTASVPAAGTSNVNATGGPAVDVSGSTVSTLGLDAVSSTNSATNGINLDALGTGTFSASSGSISGATGTAFRVANASSGTISYPGNLNTTSGSGSTASISGRTAGTITLSGAINHSSGSGAGISISGNSGGSTDFSNASKTLNTGSSDALVMSSNTGHTVDFTNGNLGVTSTSGKGVDITGGGTINLGGTGNSISTTTGRGLNVDSTTIGSSGLTFQSISSNGATNGIRLNSTGSTAGLTVTGNGSAAQGGNASGGTIQQSTNTGVFLSNTKSPSLNNLKIDTSGHGGVTGSTGVHDFSFTNGTILSSGHKAGITPVVNRDGAFDFADLHGGSAGGNNVDGVFTVTNNVLTDNWGGNVQVFNSAGTISNAVIKDNATSNTSSDDTNAAGVKLNLAGSAGTVGNLTQADISNNVFTHPRATGITILGGSLNAATPAVYGDPDSAATLKIDNNKVTGGTPDGNTNPLAIAGPGILVSINSFAKAHADITNNGTVASPILNTVSSGIGAGVAGNTRGLFNITGNVISPHNFGGAQGISIEADKDGNGNNSPKLAANVSGNTTSNTDGPGLWANMHDTNGSMLLSIKNNTFGNPTPHAPDGFEPGMQISNGSAGNGSFNPTTCADVSANTSGTGPADPANPPYHDPGIDLYKRSTSSSTYVFGFVGLSPSPATASQTQTYVAGLNPNSAFDNSNSTKVLVVSGSNFTSCTLPSPLVPAP